MDEPHTINVLISTFSGLSLPPTLSLPLPSDTPISKLYTLLLSRLPSNLPSETRPTLTTSSNKQLLPSSTSPISSLITPAQTSTTTTFTTITTSPNTSTTSSPPPQQNVSTILPLRLSVPLCGGKGGFGSQLRAAGGRMSSIRKRKQGENNGSNRNLDGRRLRTVTEAKALAEYLALKPEMERKGKEERRKKLQAVLDAAEKREEEVRSGQAGRGKGRVDGKWVEDRDEAGERTREAVRKAMGEGEWRDNLGSGGKIGGSGSGSGSGDSGEEDEDEDDDVEGESSAGTTPPDKGTTRTYFGFDDEDDEFMSDSDGEEGKEDGKREESDVVPEGKGKSKV
ncbi:hypothetical protein MMC25_006578 [Agyrium rufum]|nr:hypothetical protein [Agyrium rufum]